MSNQTTWTDDAGGIFNANAAKPLPVGGGVPSGTADTGTSVKIGAVFNTTPPTVTNGQRVDLQANSHGSLLVQLTNSTLNPVEATPFNADGQSASIFGVNAGAYGMTFNGTTWDRTKKPNLTSRIPSAAASTNATLAKNSAGEVHMITATNTTAALKYLKLYNKATAPTVGTDTPVLTIALPVSNAAYVLPIPNGGQYFSTGIAYALTGAAADADATALAAGDVVGVNIVYS